MSAAYRSALWVYGPFSDREAAESAHARAADIGQRAAGIICVVSSGLSVEGWVGWDGHFGHM
eukprot:2933782-Alexandrium_andersonii.AAC.1